MEFNALALDSLLEYIRGLSFLQEPLDLKFKIMYDR